MKPEHASAGWKTNERFPEMVHIVLLSARALASVELRAIFEETFAIRGKQAWPPEISIHETWGEPLEKRGHPQITAGGICRDVAAQ